MTTIHDLHGLHPFAAFDVASLLDLQGELRGHRPFLIWEPLEGEGAVWSYARFAEDTRRIAAGLARRGVRLGERVLIHLDNSPEAIVAWYACARLGAVAVTTNTRSAQDELRYFAEHSGAVAGITQPRFAESVADALPAARFLAVTATDAGSPAAVGRGPGRAEEFWSLADGYWAGRVADPTAPVSIQYTSGTTSRPKAVLWTHANALWGAKMCARNETLSPSDIHHVHLPFFHTNAQSYSVLASLWVGGAVVLQPRFSASRFWPVSLKHGCTFTSTIPFCVRALFQIEVPREHSYRLWGFGITGAPWDGHFSVKTMGWWGMTETITHGIVSDPQFPGSSMTMGRPAAEYRLSVRRTDGSAVSPGETGRLYIQGVRGLSLFMEYAEDANATQASFDNEGFFDTGDLVTPLEDGFIRFADRDKDMLKVGSENVASSEIERVIMAVPGVSEVAVVAKADPMLDQVAVAFVIPAADQRERIGELAERIRLKCTADLADFKRPREIRFLNDFPRSTIEKISKTELRRLLGSK